MKERRSAGNVKYYRIGLRSQLHNWAGTFYSGTNNLFIHQITRGYLLENFAKFPLCKWYLLKVNVKLNYF